MNQINKVHKGDWLNNQLPDKSVQLIIGDPPYFEVKGKFDFVWKSFAHYLEDVEKWALECKRVLADNGTLIWWGHAKKIAYSQVIFDKYFNLINSCIWEKEQCQAMRCETDAQRSFIPITERFLIYGNKIDDKMFDDMYHKTIRKAIKPTHEYLNSITTRDYLANKLLACGNCKNIASAKQNANNILKQTSAKPQLITEFQYSLIDRPNKKTYEELRKEYEELRKEYEELRKEYEELRRPFNLKKPFLFDVLKASQESHITQKYDHDTKKPETLTKALINTCSRKGDLVLVPFAGSGTECAMAARTKRNFIGFDIDQKYVDMANKRCGYIFQTPTFDFE